MRRGLGEEHAPSLVSEDCIALLSRVSGERGGTIGEGNGSRGYVGRMIKKRRGAVVCDMDMWIYVARVAE